MKTNLMKNNFDFINDSYNELGIPEFVTRNNRKPRINNSEYYSQSLRIIKYSTEEFITSFEVKRFSRFIEERVLYLKENIDEDQDLEVFEMSKETMWNFVKQIKSATFPMISLDNVGNVVFEWRKFNDYDMLLILFDSDDKMSITGIKENRAILRFSGILDEGIRQFLNLKYE